MKWGRWWILTPYIKQFFLILINILVSVEFRQKNYPSDLRGLDSLPKSKAMILSRDRNWKYREDIIDKADVWGMMSKYIPLINTDVIVFPYFNSDAGLTDYACKMRSRYKYTVNVTIWVCCYNDTENLMTTSHIHFQSSKHIKF